MCQLEKKLMALEEAKRDLDSRKMASDQILQSHDATVADLRLRLDKANAEKVGSGMCCFGHLGHRWILVKSNIKIGTSYASSILVTNDIKLRTSWAPFGLSYW